MVLTSYKQPRNCPPTLGSTLAGLPRHAFPDTPGVRYPILTFAEVPHIEVVTAE